MALFKKDRSFDDILNGVIMNELPVKFIASIVVHLSNGSSIVFEGEDLAELDDVDSLLKAEEMEEFREMIVDIQITMDSDLLKKSVNGYVTSLLAKHFDDSK